MKELVKIRYRSVISHGEEKMSDVYEGDAWHQWQLSKEMFCFEHPQYGEMSIEIRGNELTLKHGTSVLNLVLNQKIKNLYSLPYGNIQIEAVLKRLNISKTRCSIVYYLYDRGQILSKCYLTIDVINTDLS